jgi:hypothetical protein
MRKILQQYNMLQALQRATVSVATWLTLSLA